MEKKPNETLVAKLSVLLLKEGKAENKSHNVTFKVLEEISNTGSDGKFPPKPEIYADKKTWTDTDFADDIEGEATFEKVYDAENATKFFYTLVKWNGKEKEAFQPKAGGRGGGQSYVPKTKGEIHTQGVCGVIKSGYESAAILKIEDNEKLAAHLRVGLQAYADTIAMLEKA